MTKYSVFIQTACALMLCIAVVFILHTTYTTLFVSPTGNDANPGTKEKPLKSISLAYRRIGFGGTIYLLPGVYREEVVLSPSLISRGAVLIQGLTAANQHATIVGSESASKTPWTHCTAFDCPKIASDIRDHVFVAPWKESRNPNILTETTHDGQMHQLILARSPNDYRRDSNKYHEYWWTADESNVSPDVLVDTKNDPGLQIGNLTTTKNLKDATAVIMDGNTRCGAFMYERRITDHDALRGKITFGQPVGALTYGIQENGIGRFTKYYVENAIRLLDAPGEWFYDKYDGKLYVWPMEVTNPSTGSIEVGLRDVGIRIDASDIHIDNVTIHTVNDEKENNTIFSGAVVIGSTARNWIKNISLTHLTTQYTGHGITIQPPDTTFISGITIGHADISHTTKSPISLNARTNAPTNIKNVLITDSAIHDAATQYNEPGMDFVRVSNVRILGNHIYDNTSYGVHIKGYEKARDLVKNILIADNRIERVCQNASACSAIKFFGGKFRHAVADHNILLNNLGWSYCHEKVTKEQGFASGIFISNASGVVIQNNIASKNSMFGYIVYPRQIMAYNNAFYNNRAEYSQIGIDLDTAQGEIDNDPRVYASRHDGTVIKGNIFSHNAIAISLDPANPKTIQLDNNLYIKNTITMHYQGDRLLTLDDIRRQFSYWDHHSEEIR